ncbi:MAG: hypothetical protein AB7U20_01200 [Planctomycetaceae bacterium]
MKPSESAAASAEPPSWSPRRLQVPREHASLLCDPPLREARASAAQNVSRLDDEPLNLQGRALPHLRRWARRECLRSAREYTRLLLGRAVAAETDELIECPLFVAGHQPALYHPGVWVKNFAIGRLAQGANGVGLNLVVDNDTFAATAIRVPSGPRDSLSVVRVPFDAPRPIQPWEDAKIVDRSVFESFSDRVAAAISRSDQPRVLTEMWADAVAFQSTSSRLVDCLTAARQRQERRWGLENLELPLSRLCETEPFLWFASHLLVQLPRFRDCHNEVLHVYRLLNRVRSRNHPVPELSERGSWIEAPFWVWRQGAFLRRPVFARQEGRKIALSDGEREFARLPLAPDMDACCAVEELRRLGSQGIHFRTRALTTTLFARLCLGDIFVHGIGGAKYDEMTDQIIRRFYGIRPPAFLTMSATLHLPIAEPYHVSSEDEQRLLRQLRDTTFNADRDELGPAAGPLIAEKQDLITEQHHARTEGLTRRERRLRAPTNRRRYVRLRDINARLAHLAVRRQASLSSALEAVRRQREVNRLLQGREFAYCLYPPALLRDFFTSALRTD